MRRARRWWLKLARRRRLQDDLAAELAFHQEMTAQNSSAIGLGNATQVKESSLDLWRFNFFENTVRDLRFAARRLRRSPAYTVAVVGSLALGIGISTAMFTILNTVVLRPLPYARWEQLVWFTSVLKANSTDELTLTPDFLDWRRRNQSFEDIAGFNFDLQVVTGLAKPLEVQTVRASASLLPVLQVKPMLGRNFTREEDYANRQHVVIVSHAFWREHLGSNPSAVGKPLQLNGDPYTIVGILPSAFIFPADQRVDMITPLAKNEAAELARDARILTIVHNVIGRLKPGITADQAHRELISIQAHLPVPPFHPTITIKLLSLRDYLFGTQRLTASVLVIGSLLFLLVASANLGSLALSQLMQRDRELAVRRALGAARSRVVAQLLTENALVALLATCLGFAIALGLRTLLATLPQYQGSLYAKLPFDTHVLLFTVVLLVMVVLLFGLLPTLRVSDVHLGSSIKAGPSTVAGHRTNLKFLSVVAVFEIALVVALSSSASLLLRSFWNMRYGELGFQSQHVVASTMNLSLSRYRDPHRRLQFLNRLLSGCTRVPGIERAALSISSEIPPGVGHATNNARIQSRPQAANSRQKALMRNQEVSADYFNVLRVPLLEGRLLKDADTEVSEPVVVVSREFARRYLPRQSAVGEKLQAGSRDNVWYRIVGVVGDVKSSGLSALPEPVVYTPYTQTETPRLQELGILLESPLPLASIAPSFRAMLAALDPEQPISTLETIDQRLNNSTVSSRFTANLLAGIALLGTVLAMLGVYGVTACRARSQMREIAVRQALGATPRNVISQVMAGSLTVLVLGLMSGLLLTVGTTHLLSTMLFQVNPRDPGALLAVCCGVLVSALSAGLVPAIRASYADPLLYLREA